MALIDNVYARLDGHNMPFTGPLNSKILNNIHFADQYALGSSTGGIQEAINACPDGGIVFLSASIYIISTTILIDKRITLAGSGWGSQLQVAASMNGTTDVILLKPTSIVQGIRLQDFYISPASGTPARYGINIDGTNAAVSNFVIDHIRIDALGSYGLAVTNASGLTTGTPFTTTIRDSVMYGGVNFTNAGDNLNLQNNVFAGAGDIIINQVGGATSDGGAHGFLMLNNNVTLNGGTIIRNAWSGLIACNNFEQVAASTQINNALLDIQGNASANIENLKIYGNYLGANSSYVADAIRVDRATAAEISENYVVQGSGKAYRITANANRTSLKFNRQAPAGSAIGVYLDDLGTNTQVLYVNKDTGILTVAPNLAVSSVAGVTGTAMTSARIIAAAATGIFGFSNGDPSANAPRTGITELAAGIIAVGNGTSGNGSGQVVASAFRSNTSPRANTGVIRLGSGDGFNFRNNADSADVNGLSKNSSDVVVVGDVAGVQLGSTSSTPIKKYIEGTVVQNLGTINANSSLDTNTITVLGAVDGDLAFGSALGAVASIPGLVITAYVSATDTVKVRVTNVTTGNIVTGATTYRAGVVVH